jgi:Zn-finger nucleic acid-binding protein
VICPKCTGNFESHSLGEIQVEECTQCHGIWFDQGELRKAKDAADSDLDWLDIDIWKDQDLFHVAEHSMLCPRCQVNMAAVQYGATGVTVDTCPNCRGIWLDNGEFEQIISALEEQITKMSARDYEKAALQEARELVAGKEGFVSEWRDFRTVFRLLQYRYFIENPKVEAAINSWNVSGPFH